MLNWTVWNRTVWTLLNWIAWNSTVFDIETVQLCLTEVFEIELFWHLTIWKKNYSYIKLNCLKFNSVLNDPKKVDTL